jgi:hypothetical protein
VDSLNLDNNLLERLSKLFLMTFPGSAERGVIEVYYGDGFAEFPIQYFDSSGKLVEPKFTGWDSAEMVAQSELTSLISEKILPLRNDIQKILIIIGIFLSCPKTKK